MALESSSELTLPYPSPHVTGEPCPFAELRSMPGFTRQPTSTGDEAWLIATYDGVKGMCGDLRIGKSHPDPQQAPRLWDAALMEATGGHEDEAANHHRWRHTLSRYFSSRRTARWRPAAEARFDGLVRTRLAAGPPMDVRADLANPLAAGVMRDVLGISEDLCHSMTEWSDTARTHGKAQEAARLRHRLRDHVDADLRRLRTQPYDGAPGDSLLAGLARAGTGAGYLRNDELADAVLDVFLAGFETVAARMVYGAFFLLACPDQWSALREDVSLVPGAVEEILRLAVPGGGWIPRYAQVDIPHASIRAGDLVVLSFQSANRDDAVFNDASTFNIRREPNPHIAFGHGKFYCLGASLARLELSVFLTGLTRFPGLRMARGPAEEPQIDRQRVTGGLNRLLVTWENAEDSQRI
ncbi:cytochrome P450 [Streptomyces erythrochromogenes]|uniref:cytochrome P450 n=1 Tax=Streptomyces erythrochromogenes TaxID=285574 RepID=UPI0036D079E5